MNSKKNKCFITGADGFVGSHLTELLLENGFKVRALSQYNSFSHWGWLEEIPSNPDLEIVTGDVRDPHFCKEIVKEVHMVFSFSGINCYTMII